MVAVGSYDLAHAGEYCGGSSSLRRVPYPMVYPMLSDRPASHPPPEAKTTDDNLEY
jgi:hypothetical protein